MCRIAGERAVNSPFPLSSHRANRGAARPDNGEKGSTLGFQRAITDKVAGAVVLGFRLHDPTTTASPRPTPSWPSHEDSPEPVAQLKRGLIWNWSDVERSARATGRLRVVGKTTLDLAPAGRHGHRQDATVFQPRVSWSGGSSPEFYTLPKVDVYELLP